MNYLKFTKFLKEDYEKSNSKFPSIKFFRSDLILIFIWFWILENEFWEPTFQIRCQNYGRQILILVFVRQSFLRPSSINPS